MLKLLCKALSSVKAADEAYISHDKSIVKISATEYFFMWWTAPRQQQALQL